MSTPPDPEEAIVDAALELPAHERAAYLDKLCGSDRKLRELVDALLHAHQKIISAQIVSPRDPPATPTASASVPPLNERDAEARSLVPLEKPGDQIGRYKLLEQIGEGGFGVVYVAEQREPVKRRVALKIVKLGMDTRQVVGRFEAERQALALMDHPNIAKVFDGGATETGRPYFVMELVRGIKLTDYCDQHNLPTIQRLELFIQICRAIQHAHQKGIIHRDIKPSNILVTLHDGVAVPKVIDFGIAKATQQELTQKTVYTQLQQLIGTPAYMSPEQAEMSGVDIDTRSDIYSLGVLLYELLTGETPFDGKELVEASLDEIRRIIREQEPPRPSTRISTLTAEEQTTVARRRQVELPKLVSQIRGDLDWVVMKCLEKDRTRRYDTANGVAMDVQRYLNAEPVVARPPSQLYRFRKMVQRNKLAVGAASAVAAALVIGLGLSTWLFVQERQTRQRAETAEREQARQRQQAEAARRDEAQQRIAAQEEGARARSAEKEAKERGEETRHNLYAAEMNMANQVLDLVNGVRRIASVVSRWEYDRPDLRGWEWYYLSSLTHRESMTLRGHRQRVNTLAASPDGSRLASGSQDGTVRIWDVLSGRELATFSSGSNAVNSVAWSPDGSKLSSAEDRGLRIWEVNTGKELRVLTRTTGWSGAIQSVAWSSDGRRLATGANNSSVQVWDAATGQSLVQLTGHRAALTCVAWSADNIHLASAAQDGTVRVWDTIAAKELFVPLQHGASVRNVAWTSDGAQLASGGDDNMAKIWDGSTGEALRSFRAHGTVVTAVAWKPGTRQLSTASKYDVTVRQWDLARTNHSLPALRGHTLPVLSLAWGPNGSWLASGSEDGEIKIWNPAANDAQSRNDRVPGSFASVKWSPDGEFLALAAADGFAAIFDPSIETALHTFLVRTQSVSCVAWSGDGKRLATTFADIESPTEPRTDVLAANSMANPITIWDAQSGEPVLALVGHTGRVKGVAWSPDSKRLISGGWDRTARIWAAETGRELLALRGRGGEMMSVDWSPDGRRVAAGSRNQPGIQIWDAITGAELLALERAGTRSVAFSPDGARAASAHDDGTVVIWDTMSGKELLLFRGHTAGVLQVAWNPDGLRVLSVDRESLVKIWDPNDGRELLTLGKFARAAWAPDGVRLACVGRNTPAAMVIYDATVGYAVSRSEKALPGLNRWLESHPDDFGYLRRRAQVFAALGEWDKSAEDYRLLLAQGRNDTMRWFETGWWLCGPWPGSMDAKLPPETQLHPMRPIPSHHSAEQIAWQRLSTEVDGLIRLRDFIEVTESGAETFVYAQKRLWSPQDLDLKLIVNSEAALRLWWNGRLTECSREPAGTLVTLTAGWNTLLAKVSFHGTNTFSVKFIPARG